jgi:hypothetical protein
MTGMNIEDLLTDIAFSNTDFTYEAGQRARAEGKDRNTAWEEFREANGLPTGRTPARERFEDGFYGA